MPSLTGAGLDDPVLQLKGGGGGGDDPIEWASLSVPTGLDPFSEWDLNQQLLVPPFHWALTVEFTALSSTLPSMCCSAQKAL